MEGGVLAMNRLLQHTLRILCSTSDSANTSRWVYAVFWRILPRNFPPPKWEFGGGALDRAKGNRRNWILVWEDGYCNFHECKRPVGSGYLNGKFGADVFFKMSHEVYNYGEGLVGKVAADNSHRWVLKGRSNDDASHYPTFNVSIDPQPKAWNFQFSSGIQTIALISVREGVIQLGSLEQIDEDLDLVIEVQRKFKYLESIPGVFALQRPNQLPTQNLFNTFKDTSHGVYAIGTKETSLSLHEKHQHQHLLAGSKRSYCQALDDESPIKSIKLGWNTPHPENGLNAGPPPSAPMWSLTRPLFPALSFNVGAFLSKLSHDTPFCTTTPIPIDAPELALMDNNYFHDDNTIKKTNLLVSEDIGSSGRANPNVVKVEPDCGLEDTKPCFLMRYSGLELDNTESGFCTVGEKESRI